MAFTDPFTGAAVGADISTDGAGWTASGAVVSGTNFAKIGATTGHVALTVASATTNPFHYTTTTTGNDYAVTVVMGITPTVTGYGVGLRLSGSGSTMQGYLFRITTSGVLLDTRTSAGTLVTGVLTFSATIALGDTVKIQIVGSSISVYLNGTQIGTTQTNSLFTTGAPGLYQRTTGAVNSLFTSFQSDTISSGTTYNDTASDSVTSSDSFTFAFTLNDSPITVPLTAADSTTQQAVQTAAAITTPVAATDSLTGTILVVLPASDTATATDATSYTLGANTFSFSITDSVVSTDVLAIALLGAVSASGAVTGTDTATATRAGSAAALDVATAADFANAALIVAATLADLTTAIDTATAISGVVSIWTIQNPAPGVWMAQPAALGTWTPQ